MGDIEKELELYVEKVKDTFEQFGKSVMVVAQTIQDRLVTVIFDPKEYHVCYPSKRKIAKRLNRMRRMEKVKQHWKDKVKQP